MTIINDFSKDNQDSKLIQAGAYQYALALNFKSFFELVNVPNDAAYGGY